MLARIAAVALSREGAADWESIGTTRLADIKAHFEAAETDRLSSEELVDAPTRAGGSPEPSSDGRGSRLPIVVLLSCCGRQGIAPTTIRPDEGRVPKGYKLAALAERFARYLDEEPECATVQGVPRIARAQEYSPGIF